MMSKIKVSDDAAREALGINDNEWIVTLTDEELEVLKIVLDGKQAALERAINKIKEIG
jgi:hypothetical protein